MKITDIKVFQTMGAYATWTFVKVYTDSGITGVGEATLEWKDKSVAGQIEEFKELVVGQDPQEVESIWYTLFRRKFWSGGVVPMTAISGIEQALWDIKGKALGVPVYQLLGGRMRDRVRVYANGWFFEAVTPQDYARCAKDVVKQGFTAMKWDPFRTAGQVISKDDEEFAIESVRLVREAVGPRIDLLIECHGRFNMWSSTRMAEKLKPFDPFFYEEPVLHDNQDAMANIAQSIQIPVATGERLYTRWDYRPLLEKQAARIIQPDICHAGGILELKKIAAMAEVYYIAVAPHNPNGPIGTAATLQLDASIPNFLIQEFVPSEMPLFSELVVGKGLVVRDGCLMVPDRPGLGVDLNEDTVSKRPPGPGLFAPTTGWPYY